MFMSSVVLRGSLGLYVDNAVISVVLLARAISA